MEHRIQKLVSNYGYCSRRKAEDLINKGFVSINDQKAKLGDKATEKDIIRVKGQTINPEKKIYLAFNKPVCCVCALKDDKYQTVMDYIQGVRKNIISQKNITSQKIIKSSKVNSGKEFSSPPKIKQRVFPVGRLDYNTSGLLLLTNDGDFANRIAHPKSQISKTYEVEIDKSIQQRHIRLIHEGIKFTKGSRIIKAKVKKISSQKLEITLHQGQNHIVKRIFGNLGYTVRQLNRVRIGNLSLRELNLKPGEYKYLNKQQIAKLFEDTT